MILYVDTSAFVPLLIAEPSSDLCGELWDSADRLVTIRLTYVEAAAALAMAERIGRITADEHAAAREQMEDLWPEVDVIELDEVLAAAAAVAARRCGLRGYDAVHFAAAGQLYDDRLVAVAGDERLLQAWRADGIAIADTNAPRSAATPDALDDLPG